MTYFASDTPQRSAGYIAGVKSTCANQTVKRVVYSICELAPRFIKMPTLEQMQETADYFEDKYKNYSIHFANFFKLFSILNVAIYYSSIALIHLIVSWPNKPLASMLVLKKIAMKDFIHKFKSTLSWSSVDHLILLVSSCFKQPRQLERVKDNSSNQK